MRPSIFIEDMPALANQLIDALLAENVLKGRA
jgi:hypothetical protein